MEYQHEFTVLEYVLIINMFLSKHLYSDVWKFTGNILIFYVTVMLNFWLIISYVIICHGTACLHLHGS